MLCKDSKYIKYPNEEKRLGKRKEDNDKGKKKKEKIHLQYHYGFLKIGSYLSYKQANKKNQTR